MSVCSRLRGSKARLRLLEHRLCGVVINISLLHCCVHCISLHLGWHGNHGRRTCARCTAFFHFRALSSTEVERMLSRGRITSARLCDSQQALVTCQKRNTPSGGTYTYERSPRCITLISAPVVRRGMWGVGNGGPEVFQPLICELGAYAVHCAGECCRVTRTNLSTYGKCLEQVQVICIMHQ